MKTKNTIRARLTVHGMGTLTAKEFRSLRSWIMRVAKEINKEPQAIFSKSYRATLYK